MNALGLKYHFRSDRFEAHVSGQRVSTMASGRALMASMANTLTQHLHLVRTYQLQPRSLRRLLHRLKAICACQNDEALQGPEQFVSRWLVGHRGRDVTSSELCHAYQAFIRGYGGLEFSPPSSIADRPAALRFGSTSPSRRPLRAWTPTPDGQPAIGWWGLNLTDSPDIADRTANNIQTLTQKENYDIYQLC
jgi:hypothetical protein